MNADSIRKKSSSEILRMVPCIFCLAALVGALCAPDLHEMFPGFMRILSKPCILTKDYFLPEFGYVSGAMFNVFVTAVLCTALMFIPGATVNGTTIAAFFLTIGFCPWGMNAINILPPILGVFVYCLIKRKPFASMINMAMFSTALGPLMSELLFRYPETVNHHSVTVYGIALAVGVGLVIGICMPALCAHSMNFHKGYDLYNAGPAVSFLCFLLYSVLYKNAGFEAPAIEAVLSEGAYAFTNIFCIAFFVVIFIYGLYVNGWKLKGLKDVELSDSYKVDFTAKYGEGPAIMNFGIYGLFILVYYNLIGAKFTGVTFGAVFCMVCFGMAGSNPKNVLPIMVGYVLASIPCKFDVNAQAIIVGLCFASGLAPIGGKYGFIAGVVGGIMHYCLVTSVPAIHGGFSLYNGGFTAGIVCFLLVPILEHFFKSKEERKAAKIK